MDAGNRNQQSQREKFPTERQRPLPVFEHEEESSRPDVQSSSEGRHNPFTFQPSSKGRHSSSALQPSSETRRYSSSTHQPTNSTRKRKNDSKIHPAIDHQLPDFEHKEESSRPDVQSSSEGRYNPFTFQPSSKGRHRSSAPQLSSETRRHSSSAHQPTNSTRKRKNDNKIHPAIEIYADADLRCTQSTLKDVHKTDSKMYTKQTQRCIQNSRDDIHKAGSTM